MNFSIIIPVFNEEQNISQLYNEITSVMIDFDKDFEIIFVDDGSNDKTYGNLLEIQQNDHHLKIIKLIKNFGQTSALQAGIDISKGEFIITMDGDLQNDPKDIPSLIHELDRGYDVITGWRYKRKDIFSKRFVSRIANFLRKQILKDRINDSGCGLKAYRKECFQKINLYGESHRFIPAILSINGYKIKEIKVNHRPRKYGKTKYNYTRTFNGFLDMLLIRFWTNFSTRPIHLFGSFGIIFGSIGFGLGVYLSTLKLYYNEPIADRPLLILASLLIITGLILFFFGLIADILIKIYYKDAKPYIIDKINSDK